MSSCAVVTPIYTGPKRPTHELSIIDPEAVLVRAVNGQDIRYAAKFSVLPGTYEMAVVLEDRNKLVGGRYTTQVTRFCVNVKPGRTYLVRPIYSEDLWRPEVVDEKTTYRTAIRILPSALDTCEQRGAQAGSAPPATGPSPTSAPSPATAALVVPPATEATPAATPTPTPTPPPTAADAEPTASPAPAGSESPAPGRGTGTPPPAAAAIAADAEAPRRPRRQRPVARPVEGGSPDRPSGPHGAFALELGFGFGGADLVEVGLSNGNTETLSAGDGLLFALALQFTPLWLANDKLGLGFGFGAGIKYTSVGASDGSFSLTRFPLTATVHGIIPMDGDWFFLLRTGIFKDAGAEFSSDGVVAGPDIPLQSGLGVLADGGFGTALGRNVEGTVVFRYAHQDYSLDGSSFSARSFGAVGAVQFTF